MPEGSVRGCSSYLDTIVSNYINMFCVIQEIELKKKQNPRVSKQINAYVGYDGAWGYEYSEEKFERPVKRAYKITVHESYRENGKVRKRQFCIYTYNYYDFADGYVDGYDLERKADKVAKSLGKDPKELYDAIYAKLTPLEQQIENEYKLTDEYAARKEQEDILNAHRCRVKEFRDKFGSDEYSKCYDVFGNLRNEEYLEKVKEEFRERQDYEERSRRYREEYYSNYNRSHNSSYQGNTISNYNDDHKDMLKQFYKVLSRKYHPDSNPTKDTSEEMKLINQLKEQWGI